MVRYQMPDKETYDRSLNEMNAKIETLKEKLKSLYGKKKDNSQKEEISARKNELHHKLTELISQRNALNEKKDSLINKIKDTKNLIKKKAEENRNSKERVGYKSAQDIDAQIAQMEAQISSGGLSLYDEKKVVAEISALQKSKKDLSNLAIEKVSIEDHKKTVESLQKELEAIEPERTKVKKEIDAIKADLDSVKGELNKSLESIGSFYNERNALKAELNATYEAVKKLRAEHKEAIEAYRAHTKEERERKQQAYLAMKEEQRKERIAQRAREELENAEIPAYTDEINSCNTLLKYFETTYNVAPKNEVKEETVKAPERNARQVEGVPANAVVLSKKEDREDDYMVLGKGKKSGKKSGQPKAKAIRVDLEIMDQLAKLSITVPASVEAISQTVEELVSKRQYFLDNQAEKTEENKRLAREKVEALENEEASAEEVAEEEEEQ